MASQFPNEIEVSSFTRKIASQNLKRQLTHRFFLVLVVMAVLCSLTTVFLFSPQAGEGAQQDAQQVVTPLAVVGIVAGLMLALIFVLWQVIGQWVRRIVHRMAQLSRATSLFADEHLMSEPLVKALKRADARPDEIGDMALALQLLMQSVISFDQQYFAYMETLDILEEGVVELWPDGRYQRASPGWARLTGQARHVGELVFDTMHPDYVAAFRQSFEELVSGQRQNLSGRMRLQRADDIEVWVSYRFVTGKALMGSPMPNVCGVLHDITQSYLLEAHVMHMATHDALTALPNRILLEERAKGALRTAERSGKKVALCFLDLDHFKHVNDQFGHKVGDELLLALADTLRHSLRAGDTLARWGGDEFVVLLPELGAQEDAREVVAKLVAACERPIRVDRASTELNATLSIGVALYPDDANTVSELLLQADRAMFLAKEQGRNTVRFYADFAHREQDRRALLIQNRLVMAIREHQIQTWFQPIVDALTHRVVGCEALARWYDPTYGWVSPATFAPMAEKLGLIRDVGRQVWLQAMDNLQRWRALGIDIKVSVNVSRRQFFSPTFTSELHAELVSRDIPASSVELEITESVAMEDTEHTLHRLSELHQVGFGIAIDDFGTGYSSLSQLHDMPASKIKIDISFVQRANSEKGQQLIQAIVYIAGAYNLQTVAEGVETIAMAHTMRDFGVDLLQGYHFGHAMSPEDFERYLLAHFERV